MKYTFTTTKGHKLEIRQSSGSTKLFLHTDSDIKRLDDQPLKPAIVTALLQEIIKNQVIKSHQSQVDNLKEAAKSLSSDWKLLFSGGMIEEEDPTIESLKKKLHSSD
jgi:hypothetical protein